MPATDLPPLRSPRASGGTSHGGTSHGGAPHDGAPHDGAPHRRGQTLARLLLVDKLAIVALSTALVLAGCTAREPAQPAATMPTTQATAPTGLITNAPLETARSTQTMPVYWLGRSEEEVFLYREFIPAKTTDEPMVAALRTMMGTAPLDSDYYSLWVNPTRLGVSISAKNVITVDVSADAFGQKVDRGIAERSIAQLVYTATAAASMAGLVDASSSIQVSILVDGHTGYNAFGHVILDKPLTRDPAFVAPVWITDPAQGRTIDAPPLKVDGQGLSPSGSLAWSLARVEGETVGAGYLDGTVTLTNGPGQLGTFSFNLTPPPGRYELAVYINDPSMPGVRRGLDTKIVNIS